MRAIRKPLSLLLAVIMLVGLFSAVPAAADGARMYSSYTNGDGSFKGCCTSCANLAVLSAE